MRSRPHQPQPVPALSQEYAQLTLADLRSYRALLRAEQDRVSYWCRTVTTHRAAAFRAASGTATIGALSALVNSRALAWHRLNANRQVLLQTLASDLPALPDLHDLLQRTLHSSGEFDRGNDRQVPAESAQEVDLAHDQLLTYAAALREQLHTATRELLARYRADPALSLVALPSPTAG